MSKELLQQKKKSFDNISSLYFFNRLFTDLKDTDAYKEKIIDGVGSVINKENKENDWAFSSFDKIILLLKQELGEKKIKKLFKKFDWATNIDPFYIINCNKLPDFNKLMTGWKALVSKTEDSSFLPDKFVRDTENFLDKTSDASLKERVSFSITCFILLLYTFLDKKIVNSVDFKFNVIPSVETTYWVTPYKDYDIIINYLKENKLVDNFNKITDKGILLVVNICKISIDNDLCNSGAEKIENKFNVIEKLAKYGNR